MIGIVIVSHSTKLAEGIVELARNMGGADLAIQPAGGLTSDDGTLGTDPMLILHAIEQVYSEDGVLVLMDLGSAILSSEMALDLLPKEKRAKVFLCEAPIVEGAIAASVQARIGGSIQQVISEARGALIPKSTHLHVETSETQSQTKATTENRIALPLTVKNTLGLHARPAARFVQTVGKFPQETVLISNITTQKGPVNAKSINSVITLGVRQGHQIEVVVSGPNARAVLDAIQALAADHFGDSDQSDGYVPIQSKADSTTSEHSSLTGIPASSGIAIGSAILYQPAPPEIPKRQINDSQAEWDRLLESLAKTREEIEVDRKVTVNRINHDTAAIFEAHLMFLDDEALLSPTREKIFTEKQNAGSAWQYAVDKVSAGFRNLEDPYLQARGKDVEDVGRQVLLNLLGIRSAKLTLDKPGILIVDDLTPAQTTHLEPATVLGICTVFGGPTSHSAILARELGIPAVVGLGNQILALQDGQRLVVDGDSGKVFIDPEPETLNLYSIKSDAFQKAKEKARSERAAPAVTKDGRTVEVAANIGSMAGAQLAVESGAEGVGLFRTEFLFLNRDTAPDEEEQYQAYRAVARILDGYPLIIRTLDAGGDKSIPYLNVKQESNPFLGWRAIRLCLTQPELFKTQLRAILRVAAEYSVKLMFPMIATLDELRRAKSLLEEAKQELKARKEAHAEEVETGIMVEIPSVAQMADFFACEVDFFSIGTNDLTQYTFAVDRTNPKVASLGDAYHPAVLRQIQLVVEAARDNHIWVGVCGELAGDPDAIPILLGLGVTELSMSSPAIPKAKEIVRSWTVTEAEELAAKALEFDSAEMVKALVKDKNK